MQQEHPALNTLKDIKQMMERSSRFISLSGLSGIAAGICALVGAWFAYQVIGNNEIMRKEVYDYGNFTIRQFVGHPLFIIALLTLCAAIIVAFLFTYIKSKKNNIPIWGTTSKRLIINFCIPLFAGGAFLLRLIVLGYFGMIAAGSLLFYGIALVNASKYTLGEVRYLGYGQIILGLISCWLPGSDLYFWTLGFGVLHIIYGGIMWWKYDK